MFAKRKTTHSTPAVSVDTFRSDPLYPRIASYERHMKYGPVRDYWSEFVFEAYLNHRTVVVMLAGLPDVAESRPHARFNSR